LEGVVMDAPSSANFFQMFKSFPRRKITNDVRSNET
jgi:hypothetical protein